MWSIPEQGTNKRNHNEKTQRLFIFYLIIYLNSLHWVRSFSSFSWWVGSKRITVVRFVLNLKLNNMKYYLMISEIDIE